VSTEKCLPNRFVTQKNHACPKFGFMVKYVEFKLKPRNYQKGDVTVRILVLLICVIALALGVNHNTMAQNFAVEFFGNPADSVLAPDSNSLDVTGKAFTMEAWVFPTEPQAGDGIVINKENSYEMALRNGDLFMFAIQAGAWDWFGGGKPTMNGITLLSPTMVQPPKGGYIIPIWACHFPF
jgi:hypothetical protein